MVVRVCYLLCGVRCLCAFVFHDHVRARERAKETAKEEVRAPSLVDGTALIISKGKAEETRQEEKKWS